MSHREPLDDVETRVVGVLVEKALTTPDGYPLSLNALVNGANQKSNRDPVTSYTEQTISEALTRLRLHRLVREVHEAGARVAAMIGADTLILLSDIDGLYQADPRKMPGAPFIPVVEHITPEILAMAGEAPVGYSSGGMVTKLAAARIVDRAPRW